MSFAISQAQKGGNSTVNGTIESSAITAGAIDLTAANFIQSLNQYGNSADSSARYIKDTGVEVQHIILTSAGFSNLAFDSIDFMPGGNCEVCFQQDSGITIQVNTGGNLQLSNGAQYTSSVDGDMICFRTFYIELPPATTFIIGQTKGINRQN